MAKATCSACGKLVFRGPGSRPEIVCHDCRRANPPRIIKQCEVCDKTYSTKIYRINQTTCSRSCARVRGNRTRHGNLTPEQRRLAARAREKRKRVRRHGAVSEPYTLAEIAKRDRYRCGLCRSKVDVHLPYQYPQAATVDHLIPLSLGGDDTRANVQLAHRGCNARKQNRGGGEQLRLIG
jgi:5-methylcytosine-specific restriction endonuclease McrA